MDDFLLHFSGEGQGPSWHKEKQRWPQADRFFGHWFLQDINSSCFCSSADVSSLWGDQIVNTS